MKNRTYAQKTQLNQQIIDKTKTQKRNKRIKSIVNKIFKNISNREQNISEILLIPDQLVFKIRQYIYPVRLFLTDRVLLKTKITQFRQGSTFFVKKRVLSINSDNDRKQQSNDTKKVSTIQSCDNANSRKISDSFLKINIINNWEGAKINTQNVNNTMKKAIYLYQALSPTISKSYKKNETVNSEIVQHNIKFNMVQHSFLDLIISENINQRIQQIQALLQYKKQQKLQSTKFGLITSLMRQNFIIFSTTILSQSQEQYYQNKKYLYFYDKVEKTNNIFQNQYDADRMLQTQANYLEQLKQNFQNLFIYQKDNKMWKVNQKNHQVFVQTEQINQQNGEFYNFKGQVHHFQDSHITKLQE